MNFTDHRTRQTHTTHAPVRWTALLACLLFLLVSQFHALYAHNGALDLTSGTASFETASHADGDTAGPADLCTVCVALNSANPLPAFAMLPPGDRTRKAGTPLYVFKPDTGWHAPLACRPPPTFVV